MTISELAVLSLLSLRDEEWFTGWALIHALPNYDIEGEPYIDIESAVAGLVEKGFARIRDTKRMQDLSKEGKDVDWRNLMYSITDDGRVALHDALH